MFIAHFSEQPFQDPKLSTTKFLDPTGLTQFSNAACDPQIGAELYNRYLDEKLYIEEVGYDGLMLNEHHSSPGCMQGVTNVGAAILARETKRVRIAILGNLLPVWEDPLWLAEQLAMIDMISHGRLVSGWVRGAAKESVTHNASPFINRERFQEAHDFIVKAWTTPGPWRWEGKHLHYRYVNPWCMPLQKPHPPIWMPGIASRETVLWTASNQVPYMALSTQLEITKQVFKLYHDTAREAGWNSGSEHVGYLWKVHVDETEELAYEVGKKYVRGVTNPFITGNEGRFNPAVLSLPGISPRNPAAQNPSGTLQGSRAPGGSAALQVPFDEQLKNYTITLGTPKTVIEKVRYVLEQVRPGSVFFWDGDGAMTHDDQMRSARLMGQEVIPALREISRELDLKGPFDVHPAAGTVLKQDTNIPSRN